MPLAAATPRYDVNVFINCPFDDPFQPLFDAIVFAVQGAGFYPRCALEISDAAQNRLANIMNIISDLKTLTPTFLRHPTEPSNSLD
jgi:hypothetical protein